MGGTELVGRGPVLGRDIVFEFLEELEIPYIFGNPGTTELPLVDGCNDHPSVSYVLSLHEDIAVAQAMGYARASGRIGVVNLHVAPGVAHGLGNLYNAYRARVPLLITAGQHHTGLLVHEPILTADLAALVRPFTKWAYEVTLLEELPIALQRAFKELTTPPFGPVFLSIATNLLLEKYEAALLVHVSRVGEMVADAAAVDRAAEMLAGASNPVILAGDGVGHARAWAEVVGLAEALGAMVYTEGYSTLWNFPARHPLFAGPMPNLATQMRDRFNDVDQVVMCGVTCQAPVSRYDERGPLIPWHVRAVSIDDSPWEVGKNQAVDVGLVGDVRRNLGALLDAVRRAPLKTSAVATRAEAARAACAARVESWNANVDAARSSAEISPTLIAAELRDLMPADAVFVDETISNRPSFVNVLDFSDPLSYFAANGLSLGYAGGAAAGIQMARPDRRVVTVVGDGSLMYYPHALWNAASESLPVLFVVLNNGSYRVLKVIIDRMGGPWAASREMTPGLDIASPGIDYVRVADGMGVKGERATTPAELRSALERGLAASTPYLVEVVLEQGYRQEG
ncbi:MAG: thiamine pyrophosphate-binding protein [Acidimicrobiales bacterium]